MFWSSKLFPYYPLNWTNKAFHCPGYKGAITGPVHSPNSAYRLGSYAYNYAGTGTHDYMRYYFGLGPMITWEIPPVAEAQIKVPSEMLAIGDSQFLSAGANQEPGGDDALFSGLESGHPFDPALHGRKLNQLWCDGHVGGMNPWVLFNRTNSAALWNSDHEPHPEAMVAVRADRLLRLQVLLLPLQAGGSGPGDEANLAFPVLHFPILSGVVEFDVGGPVDFKPAEFM